MIALMKEHHYNDVYKMLLEYAYRDKNDAKQLLFDSDLKIIKKNDEKVISAIFSDNVILNFDAFNIQSHFLKQIVTHVDYRNRQHANHLLEIQDYYAKKSCLFSVVRAYNTKLFSKHGYTKIYDTYEYTIPKQQLSKINYRNVYEQANPQHLCEVYREFTQAFKNHIVKDEAYFEKLIKTVYECNKKIVSLYHNNKCMGYAIYNMNKNGICRIDEIIYLNTATLKSLLAFISENYFDIVLVVTQFEPLHRLFKDVIYKKDKSVMIKINHLVLFNKLFNKKIKLQNELLDFFIEKSYFQDFFNR